MRSELISAGSIDHGVIGTAQFARGSVPRGSQGTPAILGGSHWLKSMLGWTLTEVGESRRAIEHLHAALDAAERDGSEGYMVRALSHLGLALWLEGEDG